MLAVIRPKATAKVLKLPDKVKIDFKATDQALKSSLVATANGSFSF